MCMVSMILDTARQVPMQQWTPPLWADLREVIRRLDEIDRKLGQPDCHDPEKAKWMQTVERRLKRLEGKRRPRKAKPRAK